MRTIIYFILSPMRGLQIQNRSQTLLNDMQKNSKSMSLARLPRNFLTCPIPKSSQTPTRCSQELFSSQETNHSANKTFDQSNLILKMKSSRKKFKISTLMNNTLFFESSQPRNPMTCPPKTLKSSTCSLLKNKGKQNFILSEKMD